MEQKYTVILVKSRKVLFAKHIINKHNPFLFVFYGDILRFQ